MANREQSIRKFIDATIKGDDSTADECFHETFADIAREYLLGEKADDDKDDDKDADDKKSDDKDDDKDDDKKKGDNPFKKSDDDDDDDDDDDKKKVDESKKGQYLETPPTPGKQPMKSSGSSKMGKSRNPKGPMDDDIKGDALKSKGSGSSKAFKEKPKNPSDYKDGVDHKAGGIKNRSDS